METKANDLIHSYEGEKSANFRGLTKLEYFAGLAMQGLLATNGSHFPDTQNFGELTAIASVKYANALIKALNEKGE